VRKTRAWTRVQFPPPWVLPPLALTELKPARLSRSLDTALQRRWHSDPLECPVCQKVMRLISVIEDPRVIEKILRHLSLRCGPARFAPARPPLSPGQSEPEPQFIIDSDPMPDNENVITD